ncbi:MAG: sulfite exporter TauE/SafE family protein [Pyrinomonadaceae bacterium MAG19_C2-C3]|nr:sulfite exporter TauE/SafE family protein [Pyrinomonadaceae bacterium MAG19_C2-C3]
MTSLWAGGLALLLGALHALEPGHGKAAIAAYTVGNRGRLSHILVLGLSTALAHTTTIIVLALILGGMAGSVAHEHIHHWFEYASAALLLILGAWMFVRARRNLNARTDCDNAFASTGRTASECSCSSAHFVKGQDGDDRTGLRFAGLMGITGGIIPCPSALAALLSAATIGHFAYGLWTVILFSIGIALTLSAVALAAHWASGNTHRWLPALIRNSSVERLAHHAPVLSAALVMLCGVYSLCRVVWQSH